MFHNDGKSFANDSRRNDRRFLSLSTVFWLCLSVLLLEGPAFATDPISLDPDPDFTTTIVIQGRDGFDPSALPPGYYLIVIVAEDGTETQYTLQID